MFTNLTPEKAYILGFISTDGNCCKNTLRIELQARDEPILRQIASLFKSEGYKPAITISTKEDRDYCVLRITNQQLIHQLETIGITARKTFTVPFLGFLPDSILPDYYRGIIDGDGSVYVRKNSLVSEVCSASSGFIASLNDNLPRLGIPTHRIETRIRNRKRPLYRIVFWRHAPVFLQSIYYPNCLCLERKRDNFNNFVKQPDKKITWFPEHDRFLIENQHLSTRELSQSLSKTEKAVRIRIWRLKKSQLIA